MEEFEDLSHEGKMSSDEYRFQLRNSTLRILQEKGKFEIVDCLGEGSYGEVIAVNSPHYEETVALKIVFPGDTWIGELTLWPILDHQNILPLLEFIRLPYADLFVMPMMYGDMETILEDTDFIDDPCSLAIAKRWLRNVLDALDYLHSQKLCHLDLKADNVLIDYEFRAVLCDFSFLSHSHEPLERYGVPVPYRPPETCLSFEKCIPVDGTQFDMWSYGILALNVFTNHFLKRRVHLRAKKWHKDIYPLLYEAMQVTYFRYLMSKAFQASNTENEFSDAFNFVQFILRVQPEDRPSIEDTINHVFFRKGFNRLDKPDDIWLFQGKTGCSCTQPEESVMIHKDNFESYKCRKTFKKIGTHYKRRRKWEKSSTIMEKKEEALQSISDIFEESDEQLSTKLNNRQLDEKKFSLRIEQTGDTQVEYCRLDDIAFPQIVDMSTQIEEHHGDDVTQVCNLTEDRVNSSNRNLSNENMKKEYIKRTLELNMFCRINEGILTNSRIENQKLTGEIFEVHSGEIVNVTMRTNTVPSASDVTGDELLKNDLRTWLREKINMCTSNIRRIMMACKNGKENKSETSVKEV